MYISLLDVSDSGWLGVGVGRLVRGSFNLWKYMLSPYYGYTGNCLPPIFCLEGFQLGSAWLFAAGSITGNTSAIIAFHCGIYSKL